MGNEKMSCICVCGGMDGEHARGCKMLGTGSPTKHSHYHRDVSKLQGMDWYRFCEVFGVTHPCAQHAGKKIVFAGMRGAKDIDKDIQEAIDTLQRWQQMRREDSSN